MERPNLTEGQKKRLAKIEHTYPLARVIGYEKNSDSMEPIVTLNGIYDDAQVLDRKGVLR